MSMLNYYLIFQNISVGDHCGGIEWKAAKTASGTYM